MKVLKYTVFFIFVMTGWTSQAQQLGLYNLYNQNLYLINPASVGMKNCYYGFVNYGKQWTGVDNSPGISGITLDGPVGRSHGLGVNLQFANAGFLTQFAGKISYAYHLQTGMKSYLHGGFSIGINNQSFDITDVIATDYTDQLLTNGASTGWGLSNDLGFMFTTPRMRLGFAIPQTFTTGQELSLATGEKTNFYAAFDIIDNNQWELQSSTLYRYSQEQDNQVDVGVRLTWENTIGMGVIYRTNYGIAAIAQLKINDKLLLAYSYDFGTNDAITSRGGSHGVLLGIRLCKKNGEKPVEAVGELVAVPQKEAVEDKYDDLQTDEVIVLEEKEEKIVSISEERAPSVEELTDRFAQREMLIRFEHASESVVISDNQQKVLKKVVEILIDDPDLQVIIVGHASSIGGAVINQRISEGRARMIANELIKLGIAPSRIKQIGKGEEEPIADDSTEEGASLNRRVQVVFIRIE